MLFYSIPNAFETISNIIYASTNGVEAAPGDAAAMISLFRAHIIDDVRVI